MVVCRKKAQHVERGSARPATRHGERRESSQDANQALAADPKNDIQMIFLTRLTTLALDWRRRENMDAIAIFCIALLAYVVGTVDDFAITLFQFGIDHAGWEADDIIFAILVVGVAMTVYGLRRYRDSPAKSKPVFAPSKRRAVWRGTTR
jgi:hypothetical protein